MEKRNPHVLIFLISHFSLQLLESLEIDSGKSNGQHDKHQASDPVETNADSVADE